MERLEYVQNTEPLKFKKRSFLRTHLLKRQYQILLNPMTWAKYCSQPRTNKSFCNV